MLIYKTLYTTAVYSEGGGGGGGEWQSPATMTVI